MLAGKSEGRRTEGRKKSEGRGPRVVRDSDGLKHPVAKFTGKAIERLAPAMNRHGQLFGNSLQGHVKEFQERFLKHKMFKRRLGKLAQAKEIV
jgi:hypothetical protein